MFLVWRQLMISITCHSVDWRPWQSGDVWCGAQKEVAALIGWLPHMTDRFLRNPPSCTQISTTGGISEADKKGLITLLHHWVLPPLPPSLKSLSPLSLEEIAHQQRQYNRVAWRSDLVVSIDWKSTSSSASPSPAAGWATNDHDRCNWRTTWLELVGACS